MSAFPLETHQETELHKLNIAWQWRERYSLHQLRADIKSQYYCRRDTCALCTPEGITRTATHHVLKWFSG